jgi:hypothetical protein
MTETGVVWSAAGGGGGGGKGEVGDREALRLLYSCWNRVYIWYFNFVV